MFNERKVEGQDRVKKWRCGKKYLEKVRGKMKLRKHWWLALA